MSEPKCCSWFLTQRWIIALLALTTGALVWLNLRGTDDSPPKTLGRYGWPWPLEGGETHGNFHYHAPIPPWEAVLGDALVSAAIVYGVFVTLNAIRKWREPGIRISIRVSTCAVVLLLAGSWVWANLTYTSFADGESWAGANYGFPFRWLKGSGTFAWNLKHIHGDCLYFDPPNGSFRVHIFDGVKNFLIGLAVIISVGSAFHHLLLPRLRFRLLSLFFLALLAGSALGLYWIWEPWINIHTYSHEGQCERIWVSDDEAFLATSGGGKVCVWNRGLRQKVACISLEKNLSARAGAISNDGRLLGIIQVRSDWRPPRLVKGKQRWKGNWVLRFWDVGMEKELLAVTIPPKGATDHLGRPRNRWRRIAYLEDKGLFASSQGNSPEVIRCWDVKAANEADPLPVKWQNKAEHSKVSSETWIRIALSVRPSVTDRVILDNGTTIVVAASDGKIMTFIPNRPKYWYGIAWLWEFWATAAFAIALLWSLRRDWRWFRAKTD